MTRIHLATVHVGAEVLLRSQLNLIRGKRIGVVTNHSALLHDRTHLVDALVSQKDVHVAALFGPEHGIRGQAPDRKGVKDEVDPKTGVPIFSLFGKTTKPTSRMLTGIDVLLFDIQDVGARFYTYTTTLALSMEAAAEKGIPVVVLDRPNPIGGLHTEGPIREERLKSFVGWLPFPIIHGLTIGEIASMIAGEGWLRGKTKPQLHVVKMKDWQRDFYFDDTDLPWTRPSPSIRCLHTALVYPGTCLIEGTNVSEGRGTDHPFEYIGAPWIDSKTFAIALNSSGLPGVTFRAITFTPRSTKAVTTDSKYEGEQCNGVSLRVVYRNRFRAVATGMQILFALQTLYSEQFQIKSRRFDELVGSQSVRKALRKGQSLFQLEAEWDKGLENFDNLRGKYLCYR
ncbi:MAG: DUF1343 domain-containing protein [Ignavibacteriales bacterium]|nr:DUF1343 domain-containing protein [Ignavibacteriales bacterium]